jgi:GNAT superfamily N-acetyltransferase
MIRLERVTGAPPKGFEALREEARAHGHSMLDTLAREWDSAANLFSKPGEALIAAYVETTLAGIGGLTIEPAIAGAYRMRRFYVLSAYRRAGVARRIALALLGGIGGRVVTANAAIGSEPFWESLGFIADHRDGRTHIRR